MAIWPGNGQLPRRSLRVGRVICAALLGAVAVVGGPSAFLFLHADALLAAATDGLLIAVVIVGVQQSTLLAPRSGGARLARRITATLCTSAAGAVVVAGLFRIMGPLALILLTVLAVFFLLVFRTQVVRPRRITELGALPTLSDAQLCTIWNETLQPIQRAGPADEFSRLAELRRAVLDELQQRHPDGFERWLRGRPRTNTNPLHHAHDRPGSPR